MIPIFKPNYDERELNALKEVFDSSWLGLGPKTLEFEQKFADYIGTKFAVALNSGTSSLDLALKLLNITKNDEVIVPTITFVSTAHAVIYNAATPVFADVDKKTLNIDFADVMRKITNKTKAIIVMHYSGYPVDVDRLKSILLNKNIAIVEDAAHAVGASYKGRKCGSLADIAAFSFHAVKPLNCGDGGALTFNNEEFVARAKRLRWLGIDKGTFDRVDKNKSYSWDYEVNEIGYKYHMNDIQAALALVQLQKLEEGVKARRECAELYFELLSDIKEVECPLLDSKDFKSSWHLYCIRCDKRDELMSYLRDKNISTGVHYKPIHLHSCYDSKIYLQNAESEFTRLLTLPLFSTLTSEEIRYIVANIKDFYAGNIH